MKKLTAQELNDTMIDVRKAYRLLYAYQRRLIDTAARVSQLTNRNLLAGYALFSEAPYSNEHTLSVNRSAWDWLPMYDYEFSFSDTLVSGKPVRFGIAFQADTGWYDTDYTSSMRVEPTDILRFSPAEDADSYVYFLAGKEGGWKPPGFHVWESEKYKSNIATAIAPNFAAVRYPLAFVLNEEGLMNTLKSANQFLSDQLEIEVCSITSQPAPVQESP